MIEYGYGLDLPPKPSGFSSFSQEGHFSETLANMVTMLDCSRELASFIALSFWSRSPLESEIGQKTQLWSLTVYPFKKLALTCFDQFCSGRYASTSDRPVKMVTFFVQTLSQLYHEDDSLCHLHHNGSHRNGNDGIANLSRGCLHTHTHTPIVGKQTPLHCCF